MTGSKKKKQGIYSFSEANQQYMKTKLTIAYFLLAGLIFSSCQKNIDVFVPDPGQNAGPDTTWYSDVTANMQASILRTQLKITPYQDTIDGSAAATIITADGVQCSFPANSCVTATGASVTGRVDVQISYVRSGGDMIRMNRPSASLNRLLVSGGLLNIDLKKNGEALHLAPGVKLTIKFPDSPPSQQMKFFAGDESNSSIGFTWMPNPDVLNNTISVGTSGYEVHTNRTGWTSCAYFYDTANITRSIIKTSLPSNYTNANTIVYIAFKDQRSVMPLLADISARTFNSGKLPDGKLATVVAISKQADSYFIGYNNIVTGDLSGVQSISLSPLKHSLPEILQILASL